MVATFVQPEKTYSAILVGLNRHLPNVSVVQVQRIEFATQVGLELERHLLKISEVTLLPMSLQAQLRLELLSSFG
jgi:hypothetical protein